MGSETIVERVKNAIRDEVGSQLCAWTARGPVCRAPDMPCLCEAAARAACVATTIETMREALEGALSWYRTQDNGSDSPGADGPPPKWVLDARAALRALK